MSLWWRVEIKTPQGGEDSTMVIASDREEAHAKAVSEFSRTHSHVRVINVELYADDVRDKVVSGFDEKGPLPRPQDPPPCGKKRLTT